MKTREVLLRLKHHIESSILATNEMKKECIQLGNLQAALVLEQQNLGKQYTLALIKEVLETPTFMDGS